ncbi:hypothetical protein [Glaesserella parasuis]|uniref:hypothetical protein n=1 Tax=Glaesserella parasuis TaxID=738 RepID=UPI000B008B6F|nr:hypothetical protein [Glaesserella parasuis]
MSKPRCEYGHTQKYDEDGQLYCPACDDEFYPPIGSTCEYCDKPATYYVQDNPVCEDHYEDAYPID